jgi:hypothetical protein
MLLHIQLNLMAIRLFQEQIKNSDDDLSQNDPITIDGERNLRRVKIYGNRFAYQVILE